MPQQGCLNQRIERPLAIIIIMLGIFSMILMMGSVVSVKAKNVPLSYKISTIAGQSVSSEEEGLDAVVGMVTSMVFLGRNEGEEPIEDIVIADSSNFAIKRLTFKKNEKNEYEPSVVRVLAGVPMDYSFYNSNKATQSKVRPNLLAVSDSGEIYFTEDSSIKKIDKNGDLQLIVKSSQESVGCGEMTFDQAMFGPIIDLQYSKEGDEEFLYFVEKNAIWKASLSLKVISPFPKCNITTNGKPEFEEINSIFVKIENSKVVVYLADKHKLKKIENNSVNTIAGNGIFVAEVQDDDLPALGASIYPNKIFVNFEGDVLFVEFQTCKIRVLNANGKINYIQKENTFFVTDIIQSSLTSNIYVEEGAFVYKLEEDGSKKKLFGNGQAIYYGDGKNATLSRMNPLSLQISSKSGKDIITVLESWHHIKVRMIDDSQTIHTIMGGTHYNFLDIEGALASTLVLKKNVKSSSFRANNGDYYLTQDAKIYKLNSEGRLHRHVGLNSKFSGDGSPATLAILNEPSGVFYSKRFGIFIADTMNNRIRWVGKDGKITSLVGKDKKDNSGLDHLEPYLRDIELNEPKDVFERNGKLYYSDRLSICSIDLISKNYEKIIGNGGTLVADGVPGTETSVNHPEGLYVTEEGDVYFADSLHHKIRKWSEKTTLVTTIAGTGEKGSDSNGKATEAKLDTPTSVYLNKEGEVYLTDKNNHKIRKVALDGSISTVFGVRLPQRVIVTGKDEVIVSHDAFITKYFNESLTGLAGARMKSYTSYDDNPFETYFGSIVGLSFGETEADLIFANPKFGKIRKISKGSLSTLAGGIGKVPALNANFGEISSVAITPENEMYITDSVDHTIRKLSMDGNISTVAGIQGIHGYNKYDPDETILNSPGAITLSKNGDLFFVDQKNYIIRKISNGVVSTIIGTPMERCDLIEGKRGLETCMSIPQGLAVSPRGDYLLFTDFSNFGIFKYNLNDDKAVVQQIVGLEEFYGYNGDGDANSVMVSQIPSLAFSNDGLSVYFVDQSNNLIRKITPYCQEGYELSDILQECVANTIKPDSSRKPAPSLSLVIPDTSQAIATLNFNVWILVVFALGSIILVIIVLSGALYHLLKNRDNNPYYKQLEREENSDMVSADEVNEESEKYSLGVEDEEDIEMV